MNKYQLAVAVKEQEYSKRLADYVRDSKFGEQWQVIAFTHADACKRYVKQGYKIDLLAAQPELLKEMKAELPGMTAAALVLKPGDSDEVHELHQYQPLPLLLQRLTEIHARAAAHPVQTAGASETVHGVKVISVYSASGGTGKTALALHLAQAAGTHRYRTFYLNLERWNTSEVWLKPQRNGDSGDGEALDEGLSELLYGLKAQPEQSVTWLMEHRKRDALLQGDYLAACTNLEDRMTLSGEEAVGLVDVIARSGQYDLVVIDLDSGLEELHTAIFEQSNQVLWMLNDDTSVRNKQGMALRYGEQKWGERFKRLSPKFVFVANRAVQAERVSLSGMNGLAYAQVQLPEVPEWRGPGQAKLLSSPSFRAAADKLFKHLCLEGGSLVVKR